jgi:nucleotide-binding universal stress UspA family protein
MHDRHDIEALRAALRDRAGEVAEALLGPPSWRGRGELRWGRRGSLSLATAGPRAGLWCHHETGEGGDLLALYQRERRATFPEGLAWARNAIGAPAATTPAAKPEAIERPSLRQHEADRERDTGALALELWRGAAEPIDNTPADRYLRRRGIIPDRLPPHSGGNWPAALRWHAGRRALVVAINDADHGLVRAVQTIALRPDGSPVTRDGRKVKITCGTLRGRAVRFGWHPPEDGRWAIAEGAETALAAAMLLGCPTWASLGASNMSHVTPPSWATSATIAADHDRAGLEAAEQAARRFRELGLKTTVITPEREGADAADLAREVAHA